MPPYTEDTLVQQTTTEYLEQELGWESVYAYNNEDFGPGKVWHWLSAGLTKYEHTAGKAGEIFMKLETLLSQIALGEDSTRQFKADVKNVDSQVSGMAAFANTGGMVLSGHVNRINDLLSMEAAA